MQVGIGGILNLITVRLSARDLSTIQLTDLVFSSLRELLDSDRLQGLQREEFLAKLTEFRD